MVLVVDAIFNKINNNNTKIAWVGNFLSIASSNTLLYF